jgi:hypothetical protein
MSALSQPQREELRDQVLEVLAAASTAAFDAGVIRRRVIRQQMLDFEPTLKEVEAALQLLIGLGYAQSTPHRLGSTSHYQVTAQGTLAFERGA